MKAHLFVQLKITRGNRWVCSETTGINVIFYDNAQSHVATQSFRGTFRSGIESSSSPTLVALSDTNYRYCNIYLYLFTLHYCIPN